ncbi:TetR/AcrR family transcriptional regulator [Rhodococcus spelaei]|uniref:TetR/AcrR family transcriptional regulator n=1 Tax=Rhodococcus spelaei TaxID=2546320 RepID=A0A541B9U7_9NOCA|nr:TetR/AcrR family transcriptional regulator [Rhodococcus spelaei]TQF69079.1 TetR/AcrR family transcriptional regulator [Rhodococcus spelaei]
MSSETAPESGTRARTRRAILDAAVEVLSQNAAAPLSDIAAHAEVGRSTLHRYYPERDDLIVALGEDALDKLSAAQIRARPTEGPADAALRRMSHECFDLGPLLGLIYGDPQALSNEAFWVRLSTIDAPLFELLERGRADGTFSSTLKVRWVRHMLWWCLLTGWESFAHEDYSRTEAIEAIDETVARITGATAAH